MAQVAAQVPSWPQRRGPLTEEDALPEKLTVGLGIFRRSASAHDRASWRGIHRLASRIIQAVHVGGTAFSFLGAFHQRHTPFFVGGGSCHGDVPPLSHESDSFAS